MKRNTIIVLILVIGIVGAVYWWTRPAEETVPIAVQPSEPKPEPSDAPAPVVKAPEPLPDAPDPEPSEEAIPAPAEPAPAAEQAPDPDDPFGGKPITEKTLAGCKQVQRIGEHELVYEFAPDGVWKVNNTARAQWMIEGDRVKIYKDGSDEVHYLDIIDNKLVYNGKVLEVTR